MEKLIIEMPLVSECSIKKCAYNVNSGCHAKAITIGDIQNPGCDTFFPSEKHSEATKRIAGVGACKVSSCRHNKNFECTTENISVGYDQNKANCLTYSARAE